MQREKLLKAEAGAAIPVFFEIDQYPYQDNLQEYMQ